MENEIQEKVEKTLETLRQLLERLEALQQSLERLPSGCPYEQECNEYFKENYCPDRREP